MRESRVTPAAVSERRLGCGTLGLLLTVLVTAVSVPFHGTAAFTLRALPQFPPVPGDVRGAQMQYDRRQADRPVEEHDRETLTVAALTYDTPTTMRILTV